MIPTTRAIDMGPLPAMLEKAAGPCAVGRAFREVDLPLGLIEAPHHRVPLAALAGLFEAAAREADDPVFGLRVGLAMAPSDYGKAAAWALAAPTLRGALRRLASALVLHQTGTRLDLTVRANTARWSYVTPQGLATSSAHHADHVLPVLIEFVRAFLGPRWMPDRVRMPYRARDCTAQLEDKLPLPWCFEGRALTLIFPAARLAASRPAAMGRNGEGRLTSCDVLSEVIAAETESTLSRLEAIVTMRLTEGAADLETVARLLGMSQRRVQRLLAEEGQTYRRLVDRVRLKKAAAMLRETDASVTQIALTLGYSEPANFSRAFQRWTGTSPREFRRVA